ncbi:guanylate kinase [Craterilacuibacter sp. RT1T]|uniref:guanylate kinase n=1 Tax=Craterilacuibacter sp. RT1T TaxID=2942211 RepID=UPI0020BF97B5|nr:guanylate kinase [Craterilacuibacter sp. RT1T]MCL6264497.1 guanylate kinase [Craterilacuibacter sp. RT1T]
MSTGSIFIVVAPSGAGKTSLVAALLKAAPDVELSVSFTTRAPRAGEIDGQHYHFVSRDAFEAMIAAGDFLEYAEVYGNYYGTSVRWIRERTTAGHDILLEIDWQGARQVREIFAEAVGIFILPPSLQVLESRLRGRGTDSNEVVERRLAEARAEIALVGEYDYIVVNDEFEQARTDLLAVVRAVQLRAPRQCQRLASVLAQMQPAG